jgi:hypothetical protein
VNPKLERALRVIVCAAVGVALASASDASALGKRRPGCDACQTCPPGGAITAQPTAPGELQPTPESPAPELSQAIDRAFSGAYDVAGASDFGALNMFGDSPGFNDYFFYYAFPDSYPADNNFKQIIQSPGTGGGVGRQKFSENTSILPVDRVFFNYQVFGNAPISPGDTTVNRFTPGIEKTFFNGATSVEVRIPFAGTVDPTQNADALGSSDVVLGNVTLFLKALLWQRGPWAFGAGLTVTTPTAPDFRLVQDDVTVLQIKNQGTHLSPYLGVIYAPGRLFTQLYTSCDFDATGRDVLASRQSNGLEKVGRLNDTTLYLLDYSIGYWIHRDNCAFLSGVAPVFEVHYNQFLGNGDTVDGLSDPLDSISIVNLTMGSYFEFNRRTLLGLALVLPVTDGLDRQFDWEIYASLNHRFGRFATTRRTPPLF